MLLGFTEVLTVYFSVKPGADEKAAITPWRNVKPGEVTMEPTKRLPSHHGRMLNLEPTKRLPSHLGRMLNLGR